MKSKSGGLVSVMHVKQNFISSIFCPQFILYNAVQWQIYKGMKYKYLELKI